ncbi:MAG: multidrug transporter subunit MdtN [Alcaligenaceae bacterium]|uniref:Multidrug transporter subunit MdtN n=1 Tax=Paenalcaligenes hermetiae TaxID=1157987 RepID=A0ABP9LVZ3_9BURK|nr:multidrug transporter subunit MdtN [Alcaligenaceae bacterium]
MESSTISTHKKWASLISVVVIVLAIVLGAWHAYRTTFNPLSEDASIEANVVHIVTTVPGRIQRLYVKEGDKVEKGQLLFTLDPELYEMRLAQAKAELAFAQATLAAKERHIQAQLHNSSITNEQIERARTNLKLATQSQARMAALAPKGYVPQQQLDQANTMKRDAEISLRQALEQAGAAEAMVSTTDAEIAMVEMRQQGLAIAERNLRETQVRAPQTGRVVGLHVSEGEHLMPEMNLFTLIDTTHWHATAMYRETALKHIEPGLCATVYVMANPNVAIQGKVENIGWGVSSEDIIHLPRGMPYVQKTVNWVRVAQRFPVQIALDVKPEHESLLRMGASATTIIHDGQYCD